MFEERPSGILVPAGIVVGDTLLRFGDPPMPDPDYRATRALGAVPTYEELWPPPRPELRDLIAQVPAQLWLRFLSILANLLARENVDATTKSAILFQIFDYEARERLETFLASAPRMFPITEFQVLLLLEIALAHAEIAPEPPERIDERSLRTMVQAVYVLWSELTEATERQISRSPAGIAAALNERSSLGAPFRRLQTGFGLWVWDHAELDADARAARARCDARLKDSMGISLDDWVTGIALATMIAQNQPPEETITNPIYISGGRDDLTQDGNNVLLACLARVSTTMAELQEACRQLGADLIETPSLLALKRKPCVHTLGTPHSYRVLSPIHLAEAAVERPRVEAETDEVTKASARTDLGTITEAYHHGLLKQIFGESYQRLPSLKKRSRADGVIWFPNGLLVVECKARRSPESRRYQVRDDGSYRDELLGLDLGKAVAQIEATTEDVFLKRIPHRCQVEPAVVGSIILFAQEVPLSEVSRSVLDGILPRTTARSGVLHLRPQIMSIERLEELDKWAHLDLLSVLVRKMQDRDVSLECLNNYLLHENETPGRSELRKALWRLLLERIRPYLNDPDQVTA